MRMTTISSRSMPSEAPSRRKLCPGLSGEPCGGDTSEVWGQYGYRAGRGHNCAQCPTDQQWLRNDQPSVCGAGRDLVDTNPDKRGCPNLPENLGILPGALSVTDREEEPP